MSPLDIFSEYRLILGSASPRRRELLAALGLPFTVETTPGLSEEYSPQLQPAEVPLALAEAKSKGFHRALEEREILITADTVVICSGQILGKPTDEEDARRMLGLLSGRGHQVITGVCLRSTLQQRSFSCTSHVEFRKLAPQEIDYYIENCRPFDKAGSYGIQEWIGYVGITSIQGSYFNIVGLPVQRLYDALREFILPKSHL